MAAVFIVTPERRKTSTYGRCGSDWPVVGDSPPLGSSRYGFCPGCNRRWHYRQASIGQKHNILLPWRAWSVSGGGGVNPDVHFAYPLCRRRTLLVDDSFPADRCSGHSVCVRSSICHHRPPSAGAHASASGHSRIWRRCSCTAPSDPCRSARRPWRIPLWSAEHRSYA